MGLAIAARAELSPVVCAILMPLSSLTVVLFACGAVTLAARRLNQSHVRDLSFSGAKPGVETPGYLHVPLRGKETLAPAIATVEQEVAA